MAKLAIKGHATRGKEVIEILKMLGGDNKKKLFGNDLYAGYFIDENGDISSSVIEYPTMSFLTLEEFLEKFPYEIGDKVRSKYLKNYKIEKMEWNATNNKVIYKLQGMGWYNTNELRPYKEEDIETITIDDFKANTKEWLIDKLESMSKDNALQAICNIHDELHKPKYPTTYEECCNELKVTHVEWWGYLGEILVPFQKLLICRDAYWKIAGKEMGLNKPWEPDWKNPSERKYCIVNTDGNITKWVQKTTNKILAFPTEEMRDAFYDNFKDLIEECKELL